MKIVVLVKEVPDTYGQRELHLETGLARRADVDRVLDEVDERALESAIAFADANAGTEVVALAMGPATAVDGIRRALAMGAASAVHVVDDALAGADAALTSEVLAQALAQQQADLVIAGASSTDGGGGVVPAMTAERLGIPLASSLDSVEIAAESVRGRRAVDGEVQSVECTLPALVSVTERMPEARMPSLKGIMGAKKKPIQQLSTAELGVDADAVVPRSIMITVARRPARAQGVKVVDEGDGAQRLAAYLEENGFLA
ncbi:MAG: electron transfer flavoprotein subunit beta/FixA family protein [Microbacteriaceae bacterium]|nr:electron transfer flavoprotein subunit beta/FixA family protein [Microbacteriaceae bacterium]